MRTPVSVGVFAALPSAEPIVDVLARSPNADVRWVCSERRRGQSPVGGRRGILQTTRCSDMLADERVDAVVIVAPIEDRSKLAASALEADKHVYVSGLLAQRAGDAEQLLCAARQRGRALVGGGLHRFDPGVRKLSELLRSGEMGELLYMECARSFAPGQDDLLWGGVAEELEVALAVLADEPTSVSAHGESYIDPAGPELLDIRLAFATGIVALIRVSALDARTGSRHAVVGSGATAVFERSPATLTLYRGPGTDDAAIVCPRLAAADPLRDSCEAFLRSVRSLTTVDPGNTVAVLEVLEHIQTSLKRGRAVELGQPARELRVVGLPARSRA